MGNWNLNADGSVLRNYFFLGIIDFFLKSHYVLEIHFEIFMYEMI